MAASQASLPTGLAAAPPPCSARSGAAVAAGAAQGARLQHPPLALHVPQRGWLCRLSHPLHVAGLGARQRGHRVCGGAPGRSGTAVPQGEAQQARHAGGPSTPWQAGWRPLVGAQGGEPALVARPHTPPAAPVAGCGQQQRHEAAGAHQQQPRAAAPRHAAAGPRRRRRRGSGGGVARWAPRGGGVQGRRAARVLPAGRRASGRLQGGWAGWGAGRALPGAVQGTLRCAVCVRALHRKQPRLPCCRRLPCYAACPSPARPQSYYGGMLCCCWSPDGRYVAAGGEDDLLAVYGLAGGLTRPAGWLAGWCVCSSVCALCVCVCCGGDGRGCSASRPAAARLQRVPGPKPRRAGCSALPALLLLGVCEPVLASWCACHPSSMLLPAAERCVVACCQGHSSWVSSISFDPW